MDFGKDHLGNKYVEACAEIRRLREYVRCLEEQVETLLSVEITTADEDGWTEWPDITYSHRKAHDQTAWNVYLAKMELNRCRA